MISCSLNYCCYCVLVLITDHESLTFDNTPRSSPKVQNLATDFSLSPDYCLMEMKTEANRHASKFADLCRHYLKRMFSCSPTGCIHGPSYNSLFPLRIGHTSVPVRIRPCIMLYWVFSGLCKRLIHAESQVRITSTMERRFCSEETF